MKKLAACSLCSFLWAGTTLAWGDVSLPPVLSDGMVLQAGLTVPVFGTAEPGEAVHVVWRGQSKSGTADRNGSWRVRLDPSLAGGPFDLKIQGKNTLTLKNVMVGEVWLASGQSNMKFPLSRAFQAPEEIAKASYPQIRYFRAGSPKWEECSPATAGPYSAMAYFFAVELHRHLGVPVGIIDASVNGAIIQTFISEEAFKEKPELAEKARQQADQIVSENFTREFKPLLPYAIRGAVWCQGEGNRGFPVTYGRLLPLLIEDWRKQWGQGDFPFLIVQLVNSQDRRESPWEGQDCAIREVQANVARSVPHAGLVVTIDLGTKDVHYPNKKPAGQRVALAARALAYGEKVECSGPVYEAAAFEKGQAIVSFTHAGGGLVAPGDGLSGFLLCGEDKKFVRAEARIEGDKVLVSNPRIPSPVAVRYGWERNPPCNLFSKAGLPAAPFRSDDFPAWYLRDEGK